MLAWRAPSWPASSVATSDNAAGSNYGPTWRALKRPNATCGSRPSKRRLMASRSANCSETGRFSASSRRDASAGGGPTSTRSILDAGRCSSRRRPVPRRPSASGPSLERRDSWRWGTKSAIWSATISSSKPDPAERQDERSHSELHHAGRREEAAGRARRPLVAGAPEDRPRRGGGGRARRSKRERRVHLRQKEAARDR